MSQSKCPGIRSSGRKAIQKEVQHLRLFPIRREDRHIRGGARLAPSLHCQPTDQTRSRSRLMKDGQYALGRGKEDRDGTWGH